MCVGLIGSCACPSLAYTLRLNPAAAATAHASNTEGRRKHSRHPEQPISGIEKRFSDALSRISTVSALDSPPEAARWDLPFSTRDREKEKVPRPEQCKFPSVAPLLHGGVAESGR